MISLPNFAEFAESVNTDEELNADNYCNQQPVAMEFTFEEHDLLNSILVHALDGMDLAIPCIYDFPEDSEIRQRYMMLDEMKNRSYSIWSQRFGNK
jgi:hypothetical protein